MNLNYLRMKNVYFLIFLGIIFSCSKTENSSDVSIADKSTSVDSLLWYINLKNSLTNCSCEMSIIRAIYKNKKVYYVGNTDPLCNSVQNYVLLDGEGKTVKTYNYSEANLFFNEVKPDSVLYRCKN